MILELFLHLIKWYAPKSQTNLINLQVYRYTQSSITGFHQAWLPSGKNKALLLFGEVGLASSLDMEFKAAANSVYTNTLRGITLACCRSIMGLPYSSSAVHLLKYLPTWLSALLKL